MIIYRAYCKATEKSFIGASVANLARIRHRASTDSRRFGPTQKDTFLHDILRYGIQNMTFTILEEVPPTADFRSRQDFWIAYFNSLAPHGYNVPYHPKAPIQPDLPPPSP